VEVLSYAQELSGLRDVNVAHVTRMHMQLNACKQVSDLVRKLRSIRVIEIPRLTCFESVSQDLRYGLDNLAAFFSQEDKALRFRLTELRFHS